MNFEDPYHYKSFDSSTHANEYQEKDHQKMMSEQDEKHPENQPRTYDPEFRGIVKNRSCTDVICLIIFIGIILGQIAISFFAFSKGRPEILFKPTDSQGNICGEGKMADKPNLFFFDLIQCARAGPAVAMIGCVTPQICVKECPNEDWTFLPLELLELRTGERDPVARQKNLMCIYNHDKTSIDKSVKDLTITQTCAAYYLKSKPILGRCLPSFISDGIGDLNKTLTDSTGTNIVDENNRNVSALDLQSGNVAMMKFFKFANQAQIALFDVKKVYPYIIALLVFGMIVSFVWCMLLNWFACIMVVITLGSFFIVFLGTSAYCTYGYFNIANSTSTAAGKFEFSKKIDSYMQLKEFWLGLAISSGLLALIILVIIIFLRSRIRLAIAIIREASKAVTCIMSSLVFPFIPFILTLATIAFWGAVMVFLASTGKQTFKRVTLPSTGQIFSPTEIDISSDVPPPNVDSQDCDFDPFNATSLGCKFAHYGGNEWSYILQAYNLVCCLWLLNFFIAFSEITLAGTFSSWYWAWSKPKDIPAFPILYSMLRVLRYHIGTIALGSLIITIIQIIRIILSYIQRKVKGAGSCPAKFCICLCQCCFYCLEKIMRFINKNAYIVTAILGKSFCPAAANAFFLVLRNCLRIAVVDNVTGFVLLLGKLTITGGITAFSFFLFSGQIPSLLVLGEVKITHCYVPVIICAIGTLIIASIFFSVMSFAVDTLFICVMEDLERNDGSQEKPYYMSKSLMDVLGNKNKFNDNDREKMCACCSCCCC